MDKQLEMRLRRLLSRRKDVSEKRMIGGLCFMVDGQMCYGVNNSGLLVRVSPASRKGFLTLPHVRAMRLGGKALTGYVLVEPAGFESDAALKRWVQRGLDFAATLPKKKPAPAPAKPRRRSARG